MRRILLSSVVLAAAVFTLPPLWAAAQKSETFQLLNLFGDVFERVRADYVEEVKDSDLIEAAINGMLTSLDPHSSYMNEKAFKEMQVQTKGEFGGLGIEVTLENGLVKVVSPIDDTPAFKAGIKSGDLVSYINDEQVLGMTLSEAVEKMRGPVGSKVKITVLREDAPEPMDFMITRDTIHIKTVRSRLEDDIAYLRVTSFTEQATDLLRTEYDRLKKESGGKLRGVLLDLRNNPGGLLDQAVSVSDLFLKQGEIVSTRERDPNKTKRFSARSGDELIEEKMPIVVLINNGSASASEIVAGALQDHKRAVILGTKSFGKGSVQTVIPLPEHGAIRLTTSRYYTPSGHSIQAKGITPDIIVEPAKIEVIKSDRARYEADLRKRLENIDDKRKAEKEAKEGKAADKEKPAEKEKDKAKDKSGKDVKPDDKSKSESKGESKEYDSKEDFQLQRGLDLLRAIDVYQKTDAGK